MLAGKKKKGKAKAADIGDVFAELEEAAAPAEPKGDDSKDPLDQPSSSINGLASTDQMDVHVPTANGHAEVEAPSGKLRSCVACRKLGPW